MNKNVFFFETTENYIILIISLWSEEKEGREVSCYLEYGQWWAESWPRIDNKSLAADC